MTNKLNASIPANNWKIIELYNKLKKGELDPSPDFQRKLVWKKPHKFKFIETILLNFPFPEIYIAPGKIDVDTLILKDMIVDGQQRCTTIENYIEGKDVFALTRIPIVKFKDLSKEAKEEFLNYEVSIRYLKNASIDQIKEIFQKINSTEYALNKTERLNAQWGESEFIFFAKQITEKIPDLNVEDVNYKLSDGTRKSLFDFFITKYGVFDENDLKRMLALQYVMTLTATLIENKYFRRNDKVQHYIELYNEEFVDASIIENSLLKTTEFIDSLDLDPKSYWLNKANVFTLIVEISKYDTTKINKDRLSQALKAFELDYKEWTKAEINEMPFTEKSVGQVKYFEFSREGVNEVTAREHRGEIVNNIITRNLIS
jgi:uncharacterized protein with ParB-like and HNH nuclease domain